jgi:hypothetical protein
MYNVSVQDVYQSKFMTCCTVHSKLNPIANGILIRSKLRRIEQLKLQINYEKTSWNLRWTLHSSLSLWFFWHKLQKVSPSTVNVGFLQRPHSRSKNLADFLIRRKFVPCVLAERRCIYDCRGGEDSVARSSQRFTVSCTKCLRSLWQIHSNVTYYWFAILF